MFYILTKLSEKFPTFSLLTFKNTGNVQQDLSGLVESTEEESVKKQAFTTFVWTLMIFSSMLQSVLTIFLNGKANIIRSLFLVFISFLKSLFFVNYWFSSDEKENYYSILYEKVR